MTALRFLLLALLLVPILREDGSAQSPPDTHIPWHGYAVVERFEESFTSIVNDPEGDRIPGSENLDPYSQTQTVEVELPFKFLLNRQAFSSDNAGSRKSLRVAITGVVSVNKGGAGEPLMSLCPGPYHLAPTGINGSAPEEHYHLLAPFWGEFTSVGLPDGGIWTKHDLLSDRQILTIEWRVRPFGIPNPPVLSFQVKFIRFYNLLQADNYRIEYHYNSAASTLLPQPTSAQPGYHGAFVGMKNKGQSAGNPSASGNLLPEEGYDGDRLLIITEPASYPNQPVFTRLETRTTAFNPDWFAYSSLSQTGQASPLFHYALPGLNFRSKPIETDVSSINGCSSCRNWLPDSVILPDTTFFHVGESLWLGGYFTNNGTTDVNNIPVRGLIYSDTTLLGVFDTTIATIGFGDSAGIRFPGPLDSSITDVSGLYRVVMIARLPNDGDRSNDTTTFHFTLRAERDVLPIEILMPELRSGPVLNTYPVGSGVTVRGVFFNSGLRPVENVEVGCRILDSSGKQVHRAVAVVNGGWDTMTARTIEFRPWPAVAGTYTAEVFSLLADDDISGNDTLNVTDAGATWRTGQPAYLGRRPEAFRIVAGEELEVGVPGLLPHLPGMNQTYSGTAPVMITLRNNGALVAFNQDVQVTIRNAGNSSVYNETLSIPALPGGGAVHYLMFPTFAAPAPGVYRLEATSPLAGDVLPDNNTATWSFRIDSVTSVNDENQREREKGITLAPNPAGGEVRLRYRLAKRTTAQITILDVQGREIRNAGSRLLEQGGDVRLDLRDMPSGVYIVRLRFEDGLTATKRLIVVQ